jgi:hypothetical protein
LLSHADFHPLFFSTLSQLLRIACGPIDMVTLDYLEIAGIVSFDSPTAVARCVNLVRSYAFTHSQCGLLVLLSFLADQCCHIAAAAAAAASLDAGLWQREHHVQSCAGRRQHVAGWRPQAAAQLQPRFAEEKETKCFFPPSFLPFFLSFSLCLLCGSLVVTYPCPRSGEKLYFAAAAVRCAFAMQIPADLPQTTLHQLAATYGNVSYIVRDPVTVSFHHYTPCSLPLFPWSSQLMSCNVATTAELRAAVLPQPLRRHQRHHGETASRPPRGPPEGSSYLCRWASKRFAR